MQGNAPPSSITGVPGWESIAEQELLLSLAAGVPENGVIVEIGCEYGMSSSLFCKAAHPSVVIYSVDRMHQLGWDRWWANLAEAKARGHFHRSLPFMLKGDSVDMARMFSKPIDLLFIDGDHSYAGCKRDITSWTPKVNPGGFVAFHDSACATNTMPHPLHYEVSDAVEEWLSRQREHWSLYKMVDTTIVYKHR